MERITSREANSSSSIQEILEFFTTYNYMYLQHKISRQKILLSVSPEIYDSVPNSPLLFPILSHINLIYAIPA